jgi:hypothetical protein
MARPAQKLRLDETLEKFQARRLVESPQTLGLLTRKPQSRHLQKLGVHALEQRIIDAAAGHRRLLGLTAFVGASD